jgi:hypothetical protein
MEESNTIRNKRARTMGKRTRKKKGIARKEGKRAI